MKEKTVYIFFLSLYEKFLQSVVNISRISWLRILCGIKKKRKKPFEILKWRNLHKRIPVYIKKFLELLDGIVCERRAKSIHFLKSFVCCRTIGVAIKQVRKFSIFFRLPIYIPHVRFGRWHNMKFKLHQVRWKAV